MSSSEQIKNFYKIDFMLKYSEFCATQRYLLTT